MPKFRVVLTQSVTYNCIVEATTRLVAERRVQRILDRGDEPDVYEVDSGPFKIDSVEEEPQ